MMEITLGKQEEYIERDESAKNSDSSLEGSSLTFVRSIENSKAGGGSVKPMEKRDRVSHGSLSSNYGQQDCDMCRDQHCEDCFDLSTRDGRYRDDRLRSPPCPQSAPVVKVQSPPRALLTVSDKTGLVPFALRLQAIGFELLACGDTTTALQEAGIPVVDVAYSEAPDLIGERVKTLHPEIYAGILSGPAETDQGELDQHRYRPITLVVSNLHPFSKAVTAESMTTAEAVEQIDIDGVSMLRAAATYLDCFTVVCDPDDYARVAEELESSPDQDTSMETRKALVLKAFHHTDAYDAALIKYFDREEVSCQSPLTLRYEEKPAQIYTAQPELPLEVLNGCPSYMKLLEALSAWTLVKELKATLCLPAAASFKHVSPAGAAVGVPLTDDEAKLCMVDDLRSELSPLATAYARARGVDRMSSAGCFIALSDNCDAITARIISREVPDGIIAPGYDDEALDIISSETGGTFCVLQIDPAEVSGLTLEQKRANDKFFTNIVSKKKELSPDAIRDLIVATITVKFMSSSVCYTKNGQVIGIGAGQTRKDCTRMAGEMAANWWLRQHPEVLHMKFRKGVGRAKISNAVANYVEDTVGLDMSTEIWEGMFDYIPKPLSQDARREWMKQLKSVALSSDVKLLFRDNVDHAHQLGVEYIAAPSGSNNDQVITDACDEHGIVLIRSDLRFFKH